MVSLNNHHRYHHNHHYHHYHHHHHHHCHHHHLRSIDLDLAKLKELCGESTAAFKKDMDTSRASNEEPRLMSLFPLLIHFLYMAFQKGPERHKMFLPLYKNIIDPIVSVKSKDKGHPGGNTGGDEGKEIGIPSMEQSWF
jgi:hypothetical protein